MLSLEELNKLLVHFLNHQLRIKMLHFQTNYYGAHTALDVYLTTFLLNFDRFMEVAQGLIGTVNVSTLKFDVLLLNDSTVASELSKFAELLLALTGAIENNADLLAIRDEMLAEVNKLQYLLRFK